MSWVVVRNDWAPRPQGTRRTYFTGAGWSGEQRHVVRFSDFGWAKGMADVLRGRGWKQVAVVRLVNPRKRCLCAGCSCLRPS